MVLVLAPSSDIVQGIIVGSLYRGNLTFDSQPGSTTGGIDARDLIPGAAEGSPETDKHVHHRIYQDGTNISYDRTTHKLAVVLKPSPTADTSLRFEGMIVTYFSVLD